MNQLYKNKEELEKARDLAGQLHGFKGNEKDILKAKADYYAAGITDEKLINKIGRKLKKCHSLSCS